MDGRRFDAFARSLVGQASRRALAGGVASGALAAVMLRLTEPLVEARRKRDKDRSAAEKERKKDDDRVSSEKKRRKKKKVTLCQNGQTIKVNKKAKKKFLRRGATPGACQDTPACTPNASACAGRECGSVDNGCGVQVPCGSCADPEVCDNTTGTCGCTPNPDPCDGRECGTADDGCGNMVLCGSCTAPETCEDATGQCVCTPKPNACAGRQCGSVDNGCGAQVPCGSNEGGCPGTDVCTAAGQCLPAACQDCDGCCTDEGTCAAGDTRQACGYGGGRCEACNPEVACVNGECTCSNGVSCGQGCCTTDVNGRPFCDNSLRPCGDTCIPKEQCCTGTDSSSYQSLQPGCLPYETCAVNASGFGECRCGTGGRCGRNNGCCTLVNGQTTCDVTLRPCGGICIARGACCSDGQETAVGSECEDGISCTSVTCRTFSGSGTDLGICEYNEAPGACPEACSAGYGYGNQFPALQREVRCGSANGQRCYCWRTTDGENVCTEDFYDAPECRTSADCANGRVCIRSGLTTGSNRCAPICQ